MKIKFALLFLLSTYVSAVTFYPGVSSDGVVELNSSGYTLTLTAGLAIAGNSSSENYSMDAVERVFASNTTTTSTTTTTIASYSGGSSGSSGNTGGLVREKIDNSCSNNLLDPGELDIDCGGNCPPCAKTNTQIQDNTPKLATSTTIKDTNSPSTSLKPRQSTTSSTQIKSTTTSTLSEIVHDNASDDNRSGKKTIIVILIAVISISTVLISLSYHKKK